MGDRNQQAFLEARLPKVNGPVLEIGSADANGNNVGFRAMYPGEYVGLDMAPGKGVDVVADLSKDNPLPEGHFALAICCSVLEHVQDPWAMARNITKVLRPGGQLYMSVPWVWRYHAYPDDYWRFSWRGIQVLFPEIEWGEPMYSTTSTGAGLFKAEPEADGNLAIVAEGVKFLPYLMLHMIGAKWTEKTK